MAGVKTNSELCPMPRKGNTAVTRCWKRKDAFYAREFGLDADLKRRLQSLTSGLAYDFD